MRFIFALILLWCGLAGGLFGQQLGESEQVVRKALGNPIAVRNSGERTIWLYSEGRKVVFEKGAVVGNSGFAEGAQADASGKPPVEEKAALRSSVSEVHVTPPAKKAEMSPAKVSLQDSLNPRGAIVGLIGAVVIVICSIGLIIQSFRASVWWGLFVLFFPIAQLFFIISHWADAKKPFLIMILVGYPLLVAGLILGVNQ